MSVIKVVILNWNGVGHLQRFLPSVVDSTPDAIKVIVADNGSEDESLEWLKSSFPEVGIIKLDKNYGFTGGYNRALSSEQLCDADYFILLNSDVETPSGWCEPLVELMDSDEKIAAVMPKILSCENRDSFEYAGACGGFIDGLGYPFCRGRILSAIERDVGQYDDTREVFWASGACLVFRAHVWRELGGFDEEFFAHMEEIDLCWRAQMRGYRIMVEPRAKVYHLGGGTLAVNTPRKVYLNYRNNLAMLYKNLSPCSLFWVFAVRMLLDGLAALLYLVTGKWPFFKAVFRAHIDFWMWLPELRNKRRRIQAERIGKSAQIYRGSIILRYIFGSKTFGRMMRQ